MAYIREYPPPPGYDVRVAASGVLNTPLILLHQKFLQFDWLRAVVFQLNLKYLHVKITNLAGSSINN